MPIHDELPTLIRREATLRDLTIADLAALAGMPRTTVRAYLRGDRALPDLAALSRWGFPPTRRTWRGNSLLRSARGETPLSRSHAALHRTVLHRLRTTPARMAPWLTPKSSKVFAAMELRIRRQASR